MSKRKAEKEKGIKDRKKKDEDALRDKAAQADEKAKLKISHARQTLSFTVDWAAGGHPAVVTYDTIEAAVAVIQQSQKDVYKAPFVVKSLDVAKGKLQKTMADWRAASTKHCDTNKAGENLRQCARWNSTDASHV
jgi:hypothetical protein